VRAANTRRKAATHERRAERQRLILDTTEAMLSERSFRDLTVEDVMREAGLPRTTFYRYFPDLESILLQGVAEISAELYEASARWYDAVGDPAAALEPAAAGLVDVYRRHGRLLLAFSDAAAIAPAVEEAWHTAIQGFIQLSTDRITELKASGVTDVAHPGEMARALVWMTERYLHETYGRASDLPAETVVDTLVTIWRRSLFDGSRQRAPAAAGGRRSGDGRRSPRPSAS
jgi:TetR/AcrR family transcriptional regulator, ethionamide resistance regulator